MTPDPTSRWQTYVWRRLDDIASGANASEWNGPYPTPETVEEARRLSLATFAPDTPTPSVVPTEDGGVAFVWHKGGYDIEVEVLPLPEGTTVWMRERDTDRSTYGPLSEYRDDLVETLAQLDTRQSAGRGVPNHGVGWLAAAFRRVAKTVPGWTPADPPEENRDQELGVDA